MFDKKKVLVIIIILLMVFSPVSVNADNLSQIIGDGNTVIFTDLKGYSWASEAISSFATQGIVKGNGNGQFKPADKVTREQFAKMLVLTFNASLITPAEPTFSDVPTNRWSNTYVETCKDFLTGYANPFGGLPTFHPSETATREDIAVALVRMMGLTDKDAEDVNYASYKFSDSSSISPSLLGYVSIAAEHNLISGYSDGTFKPQQGITRAETVVLLNRAMKQAVTSINSDLEMTANVVNGTDPKNVTIQIEAEEGTKITVDGTSVSMSGNGYDLYEGAYPYTFTTEGSKTFTIIGTKAGKTKTLNVTAMYQIGAPTLQITSCPTEVTDKSVTIRGTMYDKDYSTVLTINGSEVESSYAGYTEYWYETYDLKEGANTFTFVLTSSSGKKVTATRIINYAVGGPVLTISSCPTEVTDKSVTIRGSMYDKDYDTVLTINGSEAGSSYARITEYWSKTYDLKEGTNTFTFVLTSSSGKKVTETRTINYTVGGSVLNISSCPTEVTDKSVTIRGSMYDKDYDTVLTVNGSEVGSSYARITEYWSKTYDLKEGTNTFTFVLTSSSGKKITETRTINYTVTQTDSSSL